MRAEDAQQNAAGKARDLFSRVEKTKWKEDTMGKR